MAINPVNITRLTGLSSNLDTESIVEGMLRIDRMRVDKQFQAKTRLEWKAAALREVNSLIRAFRETNMSVLNPSTNMMSASAYNIFGVSMLTTTNAVSVSAGSSAVEGQITIDSITRLASAASLKSTDVFSGDISKDTKLGELSFKTPLEFDTETGEIAFSINDKDFIFTADSTLNEIISKVNASGAGVKMSFSSLTKGFTLTSTTTGSESKVEIVNKKGNAFGIDGAFGFAALSATGEDALLSIEGVQVTKSSNSFTIDGITYKLTDKSTTPITFNVERDIDATVEKISNFIDSYNALLDKVQGLLAEKTYRAYPPLTDAQKDEMTEKEIENWEKYAKSGMLHGDSNISSLLTKLRSSFFTKVEGTGLMLSEIGLSTGNYSSGGKITVDKAKLRSAIEKNPGVVSDLFIKTSKSTDENQVFNESGLISRLSTALSNYTKKATDYSLKYIGDQISDFEDAMDRMEEKLAAKEESLWRRFTAMETALSKMNSQSSWLASLFSSSL